jgi:hypothetical protein
MRFVFAAALLGLILPTDGGGQTPAAVPNPMASHTLFIVLIVGAFLAWAASFSFHTMKQRSPKSDRKALMVRRETILDQLAGAENAKESGAIGPERFEKRARELRGELARVIEQLNAASGTAGKRP